jgi:hypothetical protein
MAELADAADSKSAGLRPVGVRPPLPAPKQLTGKILKNNKLILETALKELAVRQWIVV